MSCDLEDMPDRAAIISARELTRRMLVEAEERDRKLKWLQKVAADARVCQKAEARIMWALRQTDKLNRAARRKLASKWK